MVRLTIYIEGGTPLNQIDPNVLTVDNSAVFRENFHKLFLQDLPETFFDLVIQPIGPVSQTVKYLQKIEAENQEAIVLIDLDGPKVEKQKRIDDNYAQFDKDKLFFMIQEMEAWILSQPEKLIQFASQNNLNRKRVQENIAADALIRDLHPEEIVQPGVKLDTILRRYFTTERKGRERPKRYSKSKDGPVLIGLLDLATLSATFEEVERLLVYIKNKP